MPSIEKPYVKTGRAKEHLDALENEFRVFIESNPPIISREDNIEKGWHIVNVQFPIPTDRLAVIAGDFAYCLRAALDYLVFELLMLATPELRKGTVLPRQDSQFPIFSQWTKREQKMFIAYTSGIPADAIQVIDSLQPYKKGNAYKDSILWKLNKLCNIDKHRRLAMSGADFTVDIMKGVPACHQAFLKNCAIMVAFPLAQKSQMNLNPVRLHSMSVRFGDRTEGVMCTIRELHAMHKFVTEDVLPRFAGFFQKAEGS